ncbi:ABC transporter ATP-binding protein [Micromonospora olivasterospora]|uniref:Putative ABC transport system ATP-binding protein n=1 Tax=Micromonospora olivasterospora TaxID=1880 RepID=A0A562I527_MICOL|nr:ATP-binding cassette domain-containing protein [Micromonospora olivasterospora]TWH65868.1 putative ABC transport system ATP-binding protein [Micromonospora olivasterospora]
MLSAEKLTLSFGKTVALAGASATVHRGEVLALVGPSGSGKSTMLYCMAGLLDPDGGKVEFDGRILTKLNDDVRSDLRRREFGFVFQFAELVPELSLRENVSLPLELNGVSRREREARVDELLDRLGIAEQAGRRPAKVSGGQAQRAAVARAMAHRPRVLFADEPTGALDSQNGTLVLDALLDLAAVDETAVVLVTHDPEISARAHRVVQMRDGVATS